MKNCSIEQNKTVDEVLTDMGFDETQVVDIKNGENVISGYTWHHHQETGRMQLVTEDIHFIFNHNGGYSLWSII